MGKRWITTVAIAGLMAVALASAVGSTLTTGGTAQESVNIAFNVSWSPETDIFEDGDSCRDLPFTTDVVFQGAPASVNGFVRVVTIRDAAHDIVATIPLEGIISEEDVGATQVTLCEVPVDVSVEPSAGYTVWYEQTYLASIPADGSLGDDPFILLAR